MAKQGRPIEWDQKRLQNEADALLDYAKLPTSVSFERFTNMRPEPYIRAHLYKLANKSEYFRNAFLQAFELIRQNREDAAMSGAMSQCVYNRTASFYDRERSLVNQSLSGHLKDMERAKRQAVQDDTVDTLKAANEAIQQTDESLS